MPDLSKALEECLEALRARRNLHQVLARYPAQRDELIELLRTSNDLSLLSVRGPDAGFRLRARSTLLAAAARARRHRTALAWRRLASGRALRLALASVMAAALLAAGLTGAAADSLPGEPLYAVKLSWEQLQLAATWDSAANARLRFQLADRRLDEAERLGSQGRAAQAADLVGQFDAAVADATDRIVTVPLPTVDVSDLTREIAVRQPRTEERLNALAGTLASQGNREAAASVQRSQSQVRKTLKGTHDALEAQSKQRKGEHDKDRDRRDHPPEDER